MMILQIQDESHMLFFHTNINFPKRFVCLFLLIHVVIVEILVAITWPITLEQPASQDEGSEDGLPPMSSKELLQLLLQNKQVLCENTFLAALTETISECILNDRYFTSNE